MREVVATITAMEIEGSLADTPAFPSSLSHGIPRTMEEVDEQTVNFRSGLIMDARHQQRQEATEIAKLKKQTFELLSRMETLEKEEEIESWQVQPIKSISRSQ